MTSPQISPIIKKYEKKDWQEVFTCGGEFPELLTLGPNVDYVRDILANTVRNTTNRENIVTLDSLSDDANFFIYQGIVNKPAKKETAHRVIEQEIEAKGKDYRFEVAEHPIKEMQNREKDNIDVGRVKGK